VLPSPEQDHTLHERQSRSAFQEGFAQPAKPFLSKENSLTSLWRNRKWKGTNAEH